MDSNHHFSERKAFYIKALLLTFLLGWFLLPSSVFAYTRTWTQNQTTPGQNFVFDFRSLPASTSNIAIRIGLKGDYNQSDEFADIKIDGRAQSRHQGGGSQCAASPIYRSYTVPASYVSDGRLIINVDTSAGVNYPCTSKYVVVTVAYTESASSDLYATSARLNSTSQRGSGSRVTISLTVRNNGTSTAGLFYVRFYYGDSSSTSGLTTIYTAYPISSLTRGASRTIRVGMTLPSTVLYGSRRIHWFIDYSNRIRERNEGNNRGSTVLNITGKPDLQISYLLLNPTSQAPGGAIRTSIRIFNAGYSRVPTGIYTAIYYSNDSRITTSDSRLYHRYNSTLNARQNLGYAVNITVPSNAPQNSTRYIGAYADYTNRVRTEVSEANNTRASAFRVTGASIDLSMNYFRGPSSTTGFGSRASYRFRVYNGGTARAGGFYVGFYYNDSTSTSGRTYLGRYLVSGLNGRSYSPYYTMTLTIPNRALRGTRYIQYHVDYSGAIRETNENNNAGRAAITLTAVPNLQVSYLVPSPTVQARGGIVRISIRVFNAGYTKTTPNTFYTRIYFSNDSRITTSDTYLGQLTTTALNARATGYYSINVRIPTNAATGYRYIGAYTDFNGRIVETSNADNTRSARILINTGTTTTPDIYISSAANSATGTRNGRVTVTIRVTNRGTANAGGFYIGLYYGNTTSTSGLSYRGRIYVRSLNRGATSSHVAYITIPSNALAGTRYIHYHADYANNIRESNENNNRTYRSIRISTTGADLYMYTFSAPSTGTANQTIRLGFRVRNGSSSVNAGRFYVRFYFGTSSSNASGLTYIGQSYFSRGLARSGITSTTYLNVRLPSNAPAGSRYLHWYVDYAQQVVETNETNNRGIRRIVISGSRSDLYMSYIRLLPSTSATGFASRVTASFRVTNRGTGSTGKTFYVRFYYGDSSSTSGLTTVYSSYAIGTLNRGATASRSLVLTLPNSVLYGSRRIHWFIDWNNGVAESSEANNRGSTVINITGRPDLTISYLARTPSSVSAGGRVTINYRVYNGGTSRATGFYSDFRFSTDTSITNTDTYLGRIYRSGLLSRQTYTGSFVVSVPANAPTGTRYLGFRADYLKNVTESRETNNTRVASITVTKGARPDLYFTSFRLRSTSAVGTNSRVTVTITVRNAGTVNAGLFYVGLYYGDSTSTSGLTLLAATGFSSLGRGASVTRVIALTLRSNVAYGTRRIHGFVDYRSQVSEGNERNNRTSTGISITGKPDLLVHTLIRTPSQQSRGGTVRVSIRIFNQGYSRNTRSFYTSIYFSTDSRITTSDTYLGRVAVGILNGRSVSGYYTINVRIPANAATGTRYIGAYADYARYISETNENNNTKAAAISITGALRADLTPYYFKTNVSSARGYSSRMTATIRVRNSGTGTSTGYFYIGFYYGDSSSTSSLTYLGNIRYSSNLARSAITPYLRVALTLPRNVLYGTRRIHYVIDYTNRIAESNEGNNRGSANFSITGKPDLVISYAIVSPITIAAGGRVVLSHRVYNAGYSRVNTTTYTGLYLSTDSRLTTSDRYLGATTSRLNALSTGAYRSTVTIPSSTSARTYYIGALADYNRRVAEGNENNNYRATRLVVTGVSRADLAIAYWKTNVTSARGMGSRVTASIRVTNAGRTNASAFYVYIYYGDSTSTSSMTYLGRVYYSGGLRARTTSGMSAIRLTLPNIVLYGSRRIHYYIDATRRVSESNENNNRGYSTLNITGKPDLQITYLTVSPTTQIPNGTSVLRYRLRNDGYSRADRSYIGFYFSTTNVISTGDALLARLYFPKISARYNYPSTTGTASVSVRVPANAQAGTRYLGAYADYRRSVSETNENNNSKAIAFKIITSKADLRIYSYTSTSSARGFGSKVTITSRVRNYGNADAGAFTVSFYYGDSTSTSGLKLLGTYTIRSLKKNAVSTTVVKTYTLPNSVLYGRRTLHYYVDSANKISESNESNNRGYRYLSITGKPDLTISSFTISPTSSAPRATIRVNYRIYNAGYSRVPTSFFTRIYFSNDSTISTGDSYLNRTIGLSSLAARSYYPTRANGTTTAVIPSNAQSGTRYIGIIADYNKRISEASEKNNTRAVPISIKGKADLVAVKLTVNPTKEQGGKKIKISYEIANRGTKSTGTYNVRFYFSFNNIIDARDRVLLSFNLSSLASGKTVKGTRTITLPSTLPAGNAYLGIFVDATNRVSEDNEKNNQTTAPFTVLVDRDGDGVTNDKDCNDNDKTIFPGAPELCDGKDNNCNKKIDEGANCRCKNGKRRACYTGSGIECARQQSGSYKCQGLCRAGIQVCANGKWGTTCTGEVKATKEICDGKDNNCNGKTDENVARSCYGGLQGTSGKGICKAGTQTCSAGKYGACKGEVKPAKETCDGQDNNCDGQIDDIKRDCYSGPAKTSGVGSCKKGTQTCKVGQWGSCGGEVTPKTEFCDGKDNDCDGKVDNDSGKSDPISRSCRTKCGTGTETCAGGKWQNCSAAKVCNEGGEGGEALGEQPGEKAGEQSGEKSGEQAGDAGETVPENPVDSSSCYTKGCPTGQICKEGQCSPDPCDGVSCKTGQFCRAGKCVATCGCTSCPSSEKCVDGQCITDPCASASCASDEVCNPSNGQCTKNPCASVTCGPKRVCDKGTGKCIDNVCSYITCPTSMDCLSGQCITTSGCKENPGEGSSEKTEPSSEKTEPSSEKTEPSSEKTENSGERTTTDTTDANVQDEAKEAKAEAVKEEKAEVTADEVRADTTTVTDSGTGNPGDKAAGGKPVVGGGCGCSVNKNDRGPFFIFLSLMVLLLPFFRRRRQQ